MNKKTRVTYKGINKDVSKSKYQDGMYYGASNMKLTPVEGQAYGSISNAYGNKLVLTVPSPVIDSQTNTITYGDNQVVHYNSLELNNMPQVSGKQIIIGDAITKNGFVLLSTDNNGFDCIWEVTDISVQPITYKLLYCRSLEFSTSHPAQIVYNYENIKNQKIYWVDGSNFLRYINIAESIENGYDRDVIDIPVESVNSRSAFDVTTPEVISVGGGGTHTSGMIQYGYTLYNLSGSETSLSPLSNLHPLDKGDNLGGGSLNEEVGAMPIVSIENIDTRYAFLRLYSVKYTTYNATPDISLIYDAGVGNHTKFTFNDTGNKTIAKVGLAEFLLTGSDAVKPQHILSKDNTLIIANNLSTEYQLDLDTRAYSYNKPGTQARVFSSVYYTGTGDIPYSGDMLDATDGYDEISEDFDAVNLDFDTFRYKKASVVIGIQGIALEDAIYSINKNALPGLEDTFDTLPITAVNGESVINNDGNIYLGYTGTIKLDIDSVVNMLGTIPAIYHTYSITILKNDIQLNSFPLNMVSTGINAQTHTVDLDLVSTDVIKIVLKGIGSFANLNITGFNADISGKVTITETISAGSNGEGGTGKYVEYELTRLSEENVNTKSDRFFKDNDIYRIGVFFRNYLGQETEAKWIADFKAPVGNLKKQYNTLKVRFTDEFYNYIATLDEINRPVSYGILRAVRSDYDKTIVTQGLMTGMMTQSRSRRYQDMDTFAKRAELNSTLLKVPQAFTRGYGEGGSIYDSYFPLYPNKHNKEMNTAGVRTDDRYSHPTVGGAYREETNKHDYAASEIHSDDEGKYRIQTAWQFNKLMQIHSPDAAFHIPISPSSSDKLVVVGYMKRNTYDWVQQQVNVGTLTVEKTTTSSFIDGDNAHFYYEDLEYDYDYSGAGHGPPGSYNLIGPSYRAWQSFGEYRSVSKRCTQLHTRKTFHNLVSSEKEYEIYGLPEVTEIGQAPKFYNDDSTLKYANTLVSIITDIKHETGKGDFADEPGVSAVDTEANRCITIALGEANDNTEDRKSIEELYNATSAGIDDWDSELLVEIRRSKEYIYSGSLYGGYDRFSRSLTPYTHIYSNDIENNDMIITSPGDTYVQLFKNTRLTRSAGSVYSKTHPIVCETLEYLTESSVNLEERDDISIGPWGRVVDPFAEEANKYNRVYSTDAVVRTYFTDNLKINAVKQLDTQIMASKIKIPGEFIESWTNFLPNEVLNLEGKYGPITGIVVNNDTMYAFQDFGIALISVNPRIQVQGQDGVSVELGAGKVLHDFNYLSTQVGSINKWGITSSNSGVFFTDATTKQIYRIKGKAIGAVSAAKGLQSYLRTSLSKSILKADNPILNTGVVGGADTVNGDVYITSLQEGGKTFTVAFNENLNAFTSFYSFTPSRYIIKGDKIFTVSPDNNQVWLHYDGDYQTYYGTKYSADITLLINTDDPHSEKVFNNIEFDSEITLDGIDVDNSTITSIEGWNDYQRTNKVPLIVGDNIRRRLRTWKSTIPRMDSSRMRMRDKWIFLKLGFNPNDNEKLVLHDMIVGYTEK